VAEQFKKKKGNFDEEKFCTDLLIKSSQPFIAWLPEGSIIFTNKSFCELIGYSREELDKIKWPFDLIPKKCIKKELKILKKLEDTNKPFRYKSKYIRKDGTFVPVEQLVHSIQDNDGEIEYYYSFITDISLGKKSEPHLNEDYYKSINYFEVARVMLLVLDNKGYVKDINKRGCEILESRKEDIIGKNWFENFLTEPFRDKVKKVFFSIIDDESKEFEYFENPISTPSGEKIISWHNKLFKDSKGNKIGIISSGEDITRYRHTLQVLKDMENKYHTLFDYAGEGIFLLKGHKIIDCNRKVLELFGLKKEEVIGQTPYDLSPETQPDGLKSKSKTFKYIKEAMRGINKIFEWEHLHSDGTPFFAEINLKKLKINNEYIIQAIIKDITAKKKSEKALLDAERKYRIVADNTYNWEFWASPEGKFIYNSPSCEKITGYKVEDFQEDEKLIYKIVHPEDRDKFINHMKESRPMSEPGSFEFRIFRLDGEQRWIEHVCISIFDEDNNYLGHRGSNSDITEQKKIAHELEKSEHNYRSLVENSLIGVFQTNIEGKILFANQALVDMFKFETSEELKSITSQLLHKHPEKRKYILNTLINEGKIDQIEFEVVNKEGETLTVLMAASYNKGIISGVLIDITDKKKYLDRLEWELDLNRSLSNIYVPLINPRASMEDISFAVFEESKRITNSTTGYVGVIEPVTGDLIVHTHTAMMDSCLIPDKKDKIRFSKDDNGLYPALWGYSLNKKEGFYTNDPLNHPSSKGVPEGHVKLDNFITTPVYIEDELLGQIALANSKIGYNQNDLDALKRIAKYFALAIQKVRSRNELLNTINEKNLYLREVHHRVKNNLQIISSLLNLQSLESDDPDAKEYCKISQDRVRSMALIHENIYQSDKISQLNLNPYVKHLITELLISYDVYHKIGFDVEIEDIFLNLDTAILLGLIINELVTNSIKHAFPGNKMGNISIKCFIHDNEYSLIIADNGVGLPAEIDPKRTKTLGLQIVNSLISQLDGKMRYERSKGTKYMIKFKKLKYENRL